MTRKRRLMPDLLAANILDIPLAKLVEMQKKAMIFDLDNTITEWNNPQIHDDVIKWFRCLADFGITACLLSNNSGPRVMEAAGVLDIPYVAKATKPRRRAFLRAMELMGRTAEDTVMVGDQIFTDIYGGNRIGMYTILVAPLSAREFIGTKIMRRIERMTMKRMGIKHGEVKRK